VRRVCITAQTFLEVRGFTNIEDMLVFVLKEINSGFTRSSLAFYFEISVHKVIIIQEGFRGAS